MGEGAVVRNAAAVVAGLTLAAAVFAARGLLPWEGTKPRHTAQSIVNDVMPNEYMMIQGSPKLQPRIINVSKSHAACTPPLSNPFY